MAHFYNYDTRGASASSQIITLERMLAEVEERNEKLTSTAVYAYAVLSKMNSEEALIAADTLDAAIWPTKKRINNV